MKAPIILGIHGLLNKPPQAMLESWWADAIAEGLLRNHNLALRPAFQLAYWADIQYPEPISLQALDEPYVPAAGSTPLARYESSGIDKARAFIQKGVGQALDREKDFSGLGTHIDVLLGTALGDLRDYYADQAKRRQMRARLSTLLARYQDRRILLIAHSMGSIIAYDVLRAYEDAASPLQVEHFVTIGAPLGLPYVTAKIRREFGATRTPKCVQRWTNLADPRDKVALDCTLADEYAAYAGIGVSDQLVYNGYVNPAGVANCHNIFGYLHAPEFSDCLRDFLTTPMAVG